MDDERFRWTWDAERQEWIPPRPIDRSELKLGTRGHQKPRGEGFTVTELRNYLRMDHRTLLRVLERLGIDLGPGGRAYSRQRRPLTEAEAKLVMATVYRERGAAVIRRERRKQALIRFRRGAASSGPPFGSDEGAGD